jgi:adenylyl-sulfate kinase
MAGTCIWLTGLPSSGKTTIANALAERFALENIKHDVLDGDVLRSMYTKSLGFSKEDRIDNGKTVSFLVSKIVKHEGVAIVSLISPYKQMRDHARSLVEAEGGTFIEVFVDAPVDTCIERDVKGLYKKALSGEIKNFTGVDDPYEVPENPDIHLKTNQSNVTECVSTVFAFACYAGKFPLSSKPRALFIGRWQPFHNGHDYIIRQKLDEGKPVLIAVRDTPIDEANPFSVKERMDMIRAAYVGEDVQVISIPDIESVNIGRNVGYAVNEYKVPEDIKGISATQIRKALEVKDFVTISGLVPSGITEYLKRKHNVV